jgi:hypothetical protein
MNPLLISGALSLAGKAVDYIQSHAQSTAAAPMPGSQATAQPFATELAATQKARLQTLTNAISQAPAVKAALAGHAGQAVQLSFPPTGGMTVQAGSGPATAVTLDASSALLANEARALLASSPTHSTTVTV